MSHPQRFQRTPLAAALGVALLPVVSSPVLAQLEEVVVTATKQEASLQDVPVAGDPDVGIAFFNEIEERLELRAFEHLDVLFVLSVLQELVALEVLDEQVALDEEPCDEGPIAAQRDQERCVVRTARVLAFGHWVGASLHEHARDDVRALGRDGAVGDGRGEGEREDRAVDLADLRPLEGQRLAQARSRLRRLQGQTPGHAAQAVPGTHRLRAPLR